MTWNECVFHPLCQAISAGYEKEKPQQQREIIRSTGVDGNKKHEDIEDEKEQPFHARADKNLWNPVNPGRIQYVPIKARQADWSVWNKSPTFFAPPERGQWTHLFPTRGLVEGHSHSLRRNFLGANWWKLAGSPLRLVFVSHLIFPLPLPHGLFPLIEFENEFIPIPHESWEKNKKIQGTNMCTAILPKTIATAFQLDLGLWRWQRKQNCVNIVVPAPYFFNWFLFLSILASCYLRSLHERFCHQRNPILVFPPASVFALSPRPNRTKMDSINRLVGKKNAAGYRGIVALMLLLLPVCCTTGKEIFHELWSRKT